MIITGREARAAVALVLKHWRGRPLPIDPAAIAELEGVAVEGQPEWLIGEGLSGAYDNDGGRPTIRYNEDESPVRQRFTIAHELGHHVLGHGARFRDKAKEFTLSNYDPVEAEANRFAAALLMPDPLVTNMVVRRGITSLSELADRFKVSQVAMKYRLEGMRLL